MSRLAIIAAVLPVAAWRWACPSLLWLRYLDQVRMRSVIPVPTAKHRPTRSIRRSQCPLRTNVLSALISALETIAAPPLQMRYRPLSSSSRARTPWS
jgi:hypothetical protein